MNTEEKPCTLCGSLTNPHYLDVYANPKPECMECSREYNRKQYYIRKMKKIINGKPLSRRTYEAN